MTEKKIPCFVIRDLLPAYVEGLTEPATSQDVQEHLQTCPVCSEIEQEMRVDMHPEIMQGFGPENPKDRKLKFVEKYRRTRRIAALFVLLVTIGILMGIYQSQFCYENTEAGRLAAAQDFIEGPNVDAAGFEEIDGYLYIFYTSSDFQHEKFAAEQAFGVIELKKGFNGRYRMIGGSAKPSHYSAGIYTDRIYARNAEGHYIWFANYNIRDIYTADVVFRASYWGSSDITVTKSYELESTEFLSIESSADVLKELGLPTYEDEEDNGLLAVMIDSVTLYDKNGEDITDNYVILAQPEESWSISQSLAENHLMYVGMVMVAILGIILCRYALLGPAVKKGGKNDKPTFL